VVIHGETSDTKYINAGVPQEYWMGLLWRYWPLY
jgi:hypothetical protein